MARPKNKENIDLPKYLRKEAKRRWRYSHPKYINEHGKAKYFRGSRSYAIDMANGCNAYYEQIDLDNFLAPKARKQPGPKSKQSISVMIDEWKYYWLNESHDDPEARPKQSTAYNNSLRCKKIKKHFGHRNINLVTAAMVSDFLQTIDSSHEYGKFLSVLSNTFRYARAKGVFDQYLPNPAEEAKLKRVPKDTVRKSMEKAQYDAIYEASPDWLKIAMTIILQTSLRQQDIWQLRWENIVDDNLYVIVEKSLTKKRKDRHASYLKFDLSQNTALRQAINQARKNRLRMQGKREAFRDCPFIVFRDDISRVYSGEKTKEHALQITKRVANNTLARVRQSVINDTNLFDGWTSEELPSFHGIRKLSLQLLEEMGFDDSFLQARAAHRDFKVTKDVYLTPNDPSWTDSTGRTIRW